MQYRSLGRSGIEASVVGFGAWTTGGWMWGGVEERDAITTIHTAIGEGINLIDTAPVYGFGASEEIVGKAIRDRRDDVVLATKCGVIWHKEKGTFFSAADEKQLTEGGDIKLHTCLAPEEIRYEIEQSLRRLGTDRIDLYQMHIPDATTPAEETMQTLMELKAEGKIRAIGCSNASVEQMAAYRGAGELDADQEHYSMLRRQHDDANLPYVAEHQMAFLAYSPLERGLLSGKLGPDRVFEDGDHRKNDPQFSAENRRKIHERLGRLSPIADAHGLSLGQLTIAWTVAQPGCTHALVGARTAGQAAENAQAGRVALSAEALDQVRRAIDGFGLG